MSEVTHRLVYLDGTKVDRVDCRYISTGDVGLTVSVLDKGIHGLNSWVEMVVYYPHVYSIKEIAR